jgi:hypothetical protein
MPDTTPSQGGQAPDEAPREPLLRIVSGSPTPDEVAVIVAVMAGRGRAAQEVRQFSLWSRKSRQVRPSLRPGFGAWRASTMPR